MVAPRPVAVKDKAPDSGWEYSAITSRPVEEGREEAHLRAGRI